MSYKTQHYQISIQPVQTVPGVGVVVGLGTSQTNVLHNLVFAFAGNFVARQHHLTFPPLLILGNLFTYEIVQLLR